MNSFDLSQHELDVKEIHRNLPPIVLYEHAIRYEKEATIAANGALVGYSGEKTGRSPKDKRIVKNPAPKKRSGGLFRNPPAVQGIELGVLLDNLDESIRNSPREVNSRTSTLANCSARPGSLQAVSAQCAKSLENPSRMK